jgi:hypothetical protein
MDSVIAPRATAVIQQRIRHAYRRQRPTPLPSRMTKGRHQSQLGVDGFDVASPGNPGRFRVSRPRRRCWRDCWTSCVRRPRVVVGGSVGGADDG